MDPYATHQRLLIAAAMQTEGLIIEMGCGDYSTPLLAEIAGAQDRPFIVYTTSPEWGAKYRGIADVRVLKAWADHPYPSWCGLTFLDNEEYVRDRKKHVPRLLATSEVVVCHDMGENEWGAKYWMADKTKQPPTIALSNHVKINLTNRGNLTYDDRKPVTVACVYKTGGDFTAEYVSRLMEGVLDHSTSPIEFVCFTDSDEDLPCKKIPLTDSLPGWWSKLELFKTFRGRTVYFDLDTIIVDSIEPLLAYDGPMLMMRDIIHGGKTPPDPREWNSSIMVWNSPLQFLFPPSDELQRLRTSPRGGDQEYIAYKLKFAKWHVDFVQDLVAVASYRLQCQSGVPKGTKIVHFHGKPRPHEVGWKV